MCIAHTRFLYKACYVICFKERRKIPNGYLNSFTGLKIISVRLKLQIMVIHALNGGYQCRNSIPTTKT